MTRRVFQSNLVPAALLWAFALAMLLGYWAHPPTKTALDGLAELKTRFGIGFSMPAQALCAAVFPFVFQSLQTGSHRKTKLAHLPWLMLFYAFLGAQTDLFYRLQAHLFGDTPTIAAILPKIAVDMLIYTPFIANPLVVWAFAFKDNGFSLAKTRQSMGRDWFSVRVLPIYRVALLVWTPAVAVIYALPLGVQFPFQALVSCFWGLILVIMTDR